MPIYPLLPKNRLILNGNRLPTIASCYAYIAKRLQVKEEMTSARMMRNHLAHYEELQIAVRHSSHFLHDETDATREKFLRELGCCGQLHMT